MDRVARQDELIATLNRDVEAGVALAENLHRELEKQKALVAAGKKEMTDALEQADELRRELEEQRTLIADLATGQQDKQSGY